ncbi:MAG TPA: ATP-grasp domain-containing protein [Gemmata sp.]
MSIGVVGSSARAAVHSLARAGYSAWAIDQFADRDLKRVAACAVCPPGGYPGALPELARQFPPGPVLYTGGLENHPSVLAELARSREVWGAPPEALARVRDPFALFPALERAGFAVPRLVPRGEPCPCEGRWLRKPFASGGGIGIRFASPGEAASPDHYFQEWLEGAPMSAVFVNDVLFGATEQLIGEPWLHAEPFAYCGNIGPIDFAFPSPELGLCGAWGIDFIASADGACLIEVNPRYTAAVEVLEHANQKNLFPRLPPFRKGEEDDLPPGPLPEGRGRETPWESRHKTDGLSAAAERPLPEGRGPGGGSASPPPFGEGAGGRGFSFALLDVHAIRFGPPLSRAASKANLVLFNRWFQLRASRTDRLRFWRGYCEARPALARANAQAAQELERATLASNRRFWMARTARYKGTHRTVRKVRAGAVRGLAVRDLPDDFLRALLANPDALFTAPGTRLLKQCAGSTVAEIEMPTPDGPRAVILKRVNTRSTFAALKNWVRSSSARRSWLVGHGLCERWLPTPRPLAVLHRYRAGFLPAEGYLLTEKVPDSIGLPEAVQACRDRAVLRAWAERLARVVRAMHDRGVSHRDLKAPNVMLARAATPVLIDLVGVRTSTSAVPFARCAKELARLNASFLAVPHITHTERLRFLRTYLGAGARGAGWKKWWNAVSVATRAKVAKNARSGRPIG